MGTIAHGLLAILRRKFLLGGIFVVAALAILVSLAFGSTLFSSEKMVKNKPTPSDNQKLQNIALALAIQDSDSDGLKDWEEKIYKTDPEKADTDGDNTPDGQEIRDSRDPLKQSPNDTVAAPAPLSDNADETGLDPKNLTQNLTAAVVASGAITAIDQNGNLTSTDFLDNLQFPDSLNMENLFKDFVRVSRRDLIITNTSDPTGIRNYFDAVENIYQTTLGAFTKSDIYIFADTVDRKNYGALAELGLQAEAVGRAASQIRKLPVPERYADVAAGQIQRLLEAKRTMEIMQNYEQDPLAAYFAFQKRISLMHEMTDATVKLQNELVRDGIRARN